MNKNNGRHYKNFNKRKGGERSLTRLQTSLKKG
jgi:hypothetical protein